jgi:nicotinamide-nucleotide amidase
VSNDLDDLILKTTLDVAAALSERGWSLATAESCTGGWIAKCCTDPAGSSRWFDRGYVSYSYEAKEEQLGVIKPDLESHGAVSEEIAAQMALLARQRSGVEFTLAATGIAGPEGGMPNKPVGLVCFAWSMRGGVLETDSVVFDGDRNQVRQKTVLHALQGVLKTLAGNG